MNSQVGEQLVTNPGAGQTPDEFLISRIGPNGEYETQYISHSSEVKQGQTVLSAQRIDELAKALAQIQQHFATLYQRAGDKAFGTDIEFKIRKDGSLQVKQARPIVG